MSDLKKKIKQIELELDDETDFIEHQRLLLKRYTFTSKSAPYVIILSGLLFGYIVARKKNIPKFLLSTSNLVITGLKMYRKLL